MTEDQNNDVKTNEPANDNTMEPSVEASSGTSEIDVALNCSNKSEMVGDYTIEYLIERANEKIDKRTEDWGILNDIINVPTLHRNEIELGRELGEGGFFTVHEIQSICLVNEGADELETKAREEVLLVTSQSRSEDLGVVQNRQFMQKHCCREGRRGKLDCRYAIKSMKTATLSDPGLFVNSLVDMAIEAKFLSSVRHPNIIKMRAVSADLVSAGADSFIVLDRLYETLREKFDFWTDREKNSFALLFDFGGKKHKAFLAERLTVGFDIASALEYLHDRNIIYRDLKPDNLGFDVRGDVKLFDFGLATEFDKEKHGTYKLTGDTGTICYMAPEVAMDERYTEKADVYSFGILLWQLVALKAPYGVLHPGKIVSSVCQVGLRPKIDPDWPPAIIKLLEDCFTRVPSRRPSMDVICAVLKREANSLLDKKLRDKEWLNASKSTLSARYFED